MRARRKAHRQARPRAGASPRNGEPKLGDDLGCDICVRADGSVWALDPQQQIHDRYVNATAELFDRCLATFCPLWQQTGQVDDQRANALVEEIAHRLEAIDPTVFTDPENWWAVILEEMRHGLI